MVNNSRIGNSNTVLEKLLKAPTLSKINEMDVNFVENKKQNFFSDQKKVPKVSPPCIESYYTTKKRKASRGRPRKNNQVLKNTYNLYTNIYQHIKQI